MYKKTNLIEEYNKNLDKNVNQTFNDKKSNILKTTLIGLALSTNVYGITPNNDNTFVQNKESIEKHNEKLNTNVEKEPSFILHYGDNVYYGKEALKISKELEESRKPNEYITKLREIRHSIVQPLRDVRESVFDSIGYVNDQKNKQIQKIFDSDVYKEMKKNRISNNDYLKIITNSDVELYDINKDLTKTDTIMYKKLNTLNPSINESNYFCKFSNFKDSDIEKINLDNVSKANMIITDTDLFNDIAKLNSKNPMVQQEQKDLKLLSNTFIENLDKFSDIEQSYMIVKLSDSYRKLDYVDQSKTNDPYDKELYLYMEQNNSLENVIVKYKALQGLINAFTTEYEIEPDGERSL